jgi:nucleoside-diphosphate-sugar epimerase
MRVFVAGASGAIGIPLVSQLVEHGHEVIGSYRSPGNAGRVQALGAEAVMLDLLDRDPCEFGGRRDDQVRDGWRAAGELAR